MHEAEQRVEGERLVKALLEGAGAVARRVMGTAVIAGMLAASLLAIFLIPVMFYVVESLTKRKEHPAASLLPHQ